jgi:small-conductance mechanosensitive channel
VLEDVKAFWNFSLATVPGGQPVTAGHVLLVLLLIVGGYYGSRFLVYLLGRRMNKASMQADVIHVVKRVIFVVFLVVIALTALSLLGIPLTAFAFATGAIAIGVGFGAQNIINNFISGWILMAERPIRINDFIEIDNAQGVVEAVGTRSTRIRRTDGVHLLVPNSQLLERTVVNWTLIDREIRTIVRVGVEYGSPVRLVADLILQAVKEHKLIKSTPPPSVVFEDFGDNALIFDTYFWSDVGGEKLLRDIRSDVRFRITELFAENDIVVAFPQRDVHLDTSSPLELRMLKDGDNAG